MTQSRKYGRTYHYPFSPGTTNDDKINPTYWEDLLKLDTVVHTEKLDGENTCLNKWGVFARSHAAPTRHPWAGFLKEKWQMIKNDLGELEIFGENVYAIHSIEYPELAHHFFVFGIRDNEHWLSWEETLFYAKLLDFETVPVLGIEQPGESAAFEARVIELSQKTGTFGSIDAHTGAACTREGIVTRNADAFPVSEQKHNIFKYVRQGHVQTDEHWSRKWRRAPLKWERRHA